MTKVLMCLFFVCETKFNIGESRTISHANETQTQQVQNLAQEDFPPKLLWNENAEFKFSVNNEREDVNKKPRSREHIAQHSEGNATYKRQSPGDRGTGDWNQRHYDRFRLWKTQIS